jgi:MFS family permease
VRGSKFGIYYSSPLLGPSLAPLVAGSLTQSLGWRAVFWFLVIFAGANFLSFLLILKDTFRRERSLIYQTVLKKRMEKREITVVGSVNIHANGNTSPVEMPHVAELTLSLMDVNPFPPLFCVLQRWNNLAILLSSGKTARVRYLVLNSSASPRVRAQLRHHVWLLSNFG